MHAKGTYVTLSVNSSLDVVSNLAISILNIIYILLNIFFGYF